MPTETKSTPGRWTYDKGLNRKKHQWKKDEAGFVGPPHVRIGKCPSGVSMETATELLNSGVPFYLSDDDEYPHNIYNVHEGVVYEAAITQPGNSYHAYPWRGDLPKRILADLETIADRTGQGKGYRKWLDKHLKNRTSK